MVYYCFNHITRQLHEHYHSVGTPSPNRTSVGTQHPTESWALKQRCWECVTPSNGCTNKSQQKSGGHQNWIPTKVRISPIDPQILPKKIGNMADKNDGSRIVNVESIYLVDSKRSCMKFRPWEHVNSQLPLSSKGVSQMGLHVKHGPCGF